MEKGKIEYKIVRSRRKTLAIQIMPDGSVVARCPLTMPDETVRKFVEEKSHWIQKHLQKYDGREPMDAFTPEQLKMLGERAKSTIPGRVALYAPLVGVSYRKITIRCQRSRWGSCSAQGNLSFNCLLMLMPAEVLDYVVVHELCHRKQMNHSAAFWAEVEKVLPNWKEKRTWLYENGDRLLARLP